MPAHHPLFDFEPAERAQLRTLPVWPAVVEAASRRDGVLDHRQLRALGLSDSAISRHVEGRRLHIRHRGVYAIGRLDLTRRGRLRAALLRYGRGAALSHVTAGERHDLVSGRERIDVTVVTRPDRPSKRSGVALHYTRRWLPGDVVWVDGLPCTSIARTLADLAGAPRRRDFVRAWNCADQRLLLDIGEIGREVRRRRPGHQVLRERLERFDKAPPTESVLEDVTLELCERFDLPRPVCQWPLAAESRSGRVDFTWPGVALEVDGRKWHAIQDAFERDRERDLQLRRAGFDPHRYTWRQIHDKAPAVAAALRDAIARGAARQ